MCAWVRRVDVGEGVTAAAAAASDPALISLLTFTDSGMLERGKKKAPAGKPDTVGHVLPGSGRIYT